MTVHQISIFLENKFGKLSEVLALLNNENINIIAATIADTSEFGLLRLIVTEPEKTYNILKQNNVVVSLTDVIAVVTNKSVGNFSQTLNYFTNSGLSFEYIYSFSLNGKNVLIIRTNNREAAREVVRRNNLEYVCEEDLAKL
ncbi:MAG: acetolactate synthase [Bacteroidales bacterium]|jgi:hypothetical protein|nr:acetolactate synthase [Bacteroidales bacterium]